MDEKKKKFGEQNKTKSTKVKNSGREAIGGGAARRGAFEIARSLFGLVT